MVVEKRIFLSACGQAECTFDLKGHGCRVSLEISEVEYCVNKEHCGKFMAGLCTPGRTNLKVQFAWEDDLQSRADVTNQIRQPRVLTQSSTTRAYFKHSGFRF